MGECLRVQSCCCGCSLAKGCIIWAVFCIIFGLLSFIRTVAQPIPPGGEVQYWLSFAFGLVNIAMNVLLILGAANRKSWIVLIYLVYFTLQTAVLLFMVVLLMVTGLWMTLLFIAPFAFLPFYINIVVYSFYKELTEDERDEKMSRVKPFEMAERHNDAYM